MLKYCLCLLVSILVSGCITTKITSSYDESLPQTCYKKILIDADSRYIAQQAIEEENSKSKNEISREIAAEIYKILSLRDIQVTTLLELAPPDWKPKEEDINSFVEKYAPDAILYIYLHDTGINSATVNIPTVSTVFADSESEARQLSGGTARYMGKTKGGTGMYESVKYSASTITTYTAICDFELYDNTSDNITWKAQSDSTMMYDYTETMAPKSIAKKVVGQLLEDKLVP